MNAIKDFYRWMKSGYKEGQAYLWLSVALYGVFVYMLRLDHYAPINGQTGAVLTLCMLTIIEGTIGFTTWALAQPEVKYKEDIAFWSAWARPIVLANLALIWGMAYSSGKAAPLEMVLIGMALVVFGLAKTLPGLNIAGRIGNTLLVFCIAVPFLLVAGLGHAIGLI